MEEKAIGFEIRAMSNLLKRDFRKRCPKELDPSTGIHGFVIGYLYKNRNKDIFQKDFEQHLEIRRSTATKMLQLMEKNGLIVRKSIESDARLKKIELTDKAVCLHKKVMKYIIYDDINILGVVLGLFRKF